MLHRGGLKTVVRDLRSETAGARNRIESGKNLKMGKHRLSEAICGVVIVETEEREVVEDLVVVDEDVEVVLVWTTKKMMKVVPETSVVLLLAESPTDLAEVVVEEAAVGAEGEKAVQERLPAERVDKIMMVTTPSTCGRIARQKLQKIMRLSKSVSLGNSWSVLHQI